MFSSWFIQSLIFDNSVNVRVNQDLDLIFYEFSTGGRLSDDQLSGIKSMLKQDEEDIYELKQELKIAQSCLDI